MTALDAAGIGHAVLAARFSFATGYDVEASDPLPLSATAVWSSWPVVGVHHRVPQA